MTEIVMKIHHQYSELSSLRSILNKVNRCKYDMTVGTCLSKIARICQYLIASLFCKQICQSQIYNKSISVCLLYHILWCRSHLNQYLLNRTLTGVLTSEICRPSPYKFSTEIGNNKLPTEMALRLPKNKTNVIPIIKLDIND